MEIGFPFMGDRLSLCRYSWAKRLTVYSFIFSFLWVSFPRYSYSFVPAIAAVAARAVIPKVVGRVLVRRFAANDAIYMASQLTATRVFVGRAAANAAEYLPAASSYKMSGVAATVLYFSLELIAARLGKYQTLILTTFSVPVIKLTSFLRPSGYSLMTHPSGVFFSA